jgi:hypothetical protein
MEQNKKLVRDWGEDTAYTAKGHFKAADVKKRQIFILLFINIIFAIVSITDCTFNICPIIIKIFGLISLIASIWLLIDESQEGKNSFREHKNIGEEYLSLHKNLQRLFHKESPITDNEIQEISGCYNSLRKKDQPMISSIAHGMATKAIEKKGEMNTWWKNTETT